MSNVPTNLIPTRITGLPEYTGTSTEGYLPYILEGRTFKVQFGQLAAVGAVPSTRVIAAGTGLAGGGDLSENRVISIAPGGVGFDQLSASGVVAGTYGSGAAVPVVTVDVKGRVTDISTTPLSITGYVPDSRLVSTGAGLLGGGSLAANRTLSVDFYASAPQALGSASPGVSNAAARGDHVHPAVNLSDTTQTQGALPLGRGGTGDALSPVAGAVVYSTGTKFALADPGDPGQVFTSNGAGEPYWRTVSGTGTVTNVSVITANGFGGTVAYADTAPQITLTTTVNGMAKGDGLSMLAAIPGTDYVAPSAYISSGLTMATSRLLGRTNLGTGEAQEITVGTGLTLSGGALVNSAPDQTVSLTAGTAISIGGSYPSFTITNTAPDQVVSLTAGTGMSVSGTYPSFTLTNTAPDQVVSLTGAGTTVVTGTYPNFTITSNDQYVGTVTSVAASGGSTGLTFSGSPITTSGTLTLSGTLAVASGGTGQTSYTDGQLLIGNSVGNTLAKATLTAGSGVSISNGNGSITISATGTGGTVTSVNASGGSTGLTFSGGPVTSSGTLTLGGTLAVASGGTGAATAGAARTALGAAASGANTDITSIALTSGTITNAPVNGTDIANKAYVDTISAGINFHQAVRLASAAALSAYTYNNGSSGVGATITANANGALTLDGVAAASSDRVLIKNETSGNAPYNGVYVVTQTGNGSTPFILTRANDYNTAGTGVNQIDAGDFFLVTAGSTQANTSWVQQTPLPIVVGTTGIVFSQFAAPITYSAGTGLTLAGTVFSITNTGVTASTYGSASSVPVLAVNAQGQITSASSSAIAIAASQVTSGVLAVAQGGTGQSSYTDGQLLIGNSTGNTLTKATLTAGTNVSITNGAGAITINATDQYTGTVTSVAASGGTTGLTFTGSPITSSGTLTLGGTLAVGSGGTGATSLTTNGVLYGNGTSAVAATAAGTTGQVLVGNTGGAPTWATLSGIGVTSFSAGTTGLTPSTGTTGAVTLAGTLNVANGGTGATSLTSGYLVKGNGTSAVSASVVYDTGTNVGIGITSPSAKLDLAAGSGASVNAIRVRSIAGNANGFNIVTDSTTDNIYLNNYYNAAMLFGTNNTERMRLDSSGNLLVGTTSASGQLTVQTAGGNTGFFDSTDTTGGLKGVAIRSIASSGSATPFLALRQWRSSFTGGDVAQIRFDGLTTTGSYAEFASIYALSGTNTASGAPTAITFQTMNASFVSAERMRIDSSGNVGIGTSSPAYKLDVSGVINTNAAVRMTPTNVGGFTRAQLQSAYNLDGTAASVFTWNYTNGGGELDLFINRDGGGVGGLKIYDFPSTSGNPTNILTVEGSGNVGIGTSSPAFTHGSGLQVVAATTATVRVQYSGGYATELFADSTGTNLWQLSAANLTLGTSNTERMRIDSSGYVLIGKTAASGLSEQLGVNRASDGTISMFSRSGGTYNPYLRITATDASALTTIDGNSSAGSPQLAFSTNSTERMRIDSSGNVGIGTSSPSYLLQLNQNGNTQAWISATNAGTNSAGIGFENQGQRNWQIWADRTNDALQFGNNSRVTVNMVINSSGNVGIGTSSPSSKLTVGGNPPQSGAIAGVVAAGGISLALSDNTNSSLYVKHPSGGVAQIGTDSGGQLAFATNGFTTQLQINASGGITSAALADAVGYKGLPQNSQTASYTLALSDMGKHISITTGGVVIPANASVAFPIGATIAIFNNSASNQTISITTDTLRQAGTANTGSRTLAQYGLATCVKVASTTWVISGAGVS